MTRDSSAEAYRTCPERWPASPLCGGLYTTHACGKPPHPGGPHHCECGQPKPPSLIEGKS